MKKSRISTLLLFCALLAGLSLLLYPTLSDYWNSLHQSRAITQYAQEVTDLNAQRYAAMLESAHQYNQALLTKADRFEMSEAEQAEYAAQLDVSGTGIIGYIEIPEIKCSLPIYHGVDEAVLQIAVGHIAARPCPWAERARIASFPDTAACPAPGYLPIWTGWRRAICS